MALAAGASGAHVYDWAKARGYWLRAGDPARPTHLLLDGGRLRVPDEAAGAFLNAYAISLARCPSRPPCLVELRTPVFRMFLDIDSRFASAQDAAAAAAGSDAVLAVLAAIADAVQPGARAMVCVANRPKADGEHHKLGFHIVFPDVLVTSATALRVREFVVGRLEGKTMPGMVVPWDRAVDASVLRSSGLRMPWSAKGAADSRFYQLRFVLRDGEVTRKTPASVSEVREALHSLSIRRPGAAPTAGFEGEDDDAAEDDAADGPHHIVAKPLAAYADVLADVAAALPLQFTGQRFTGIMVSDRCVMIRSTARYCFNLGRAHRTNNVYFMLTSRGVCQRCYCRCETTEGRRYGMCKDFSSDFWQVPRKVLDAFFGQHAPPPPASPATTNGTANGGAKASPTPAAAAAAQAAQGVARRVSAMPSRAAKLDIDALMARSRPRPAAGGSGKGKSGGTGRATTTTSSSAAAKRPRTATVQ